MQSSHNAMIAFARCAKLLKLSQGSFANLSLYISGIGTNRAALQYSLFRLEE
jgi:hypothetical protein